MNQSSEETAIQNAQNLAYSKLPAITASFWIMKIAATTLGETAGDLLSMTLQIGYLVSLVILLIFFAIALFVQLKAQRFNPFVYWAVILATSMAGTEMSDFMDRTLKLGYPLGTTILLSALIIVLVVWRLSTGSLDLAKIKTLRDELFYWGAILTSNTLGTALGDFLATSSGLGFMGSNLLITCFLGLALAGRYWTNFSRVCLFWFAFVLTRPFGATFGDLLTKNHADGGLGFGTVGSSAVLAVILIACILWIKPSSAPIDSKSKD